MILPLFQLLISFATICTLIYTFAKFTQKPTDTLRERIDNLEQRADDMDKWAENIERRLHEGVEHFIALDEANKVTQQALLALLDNALGNDDGTELKKARNKLYEHLSER